MMLLLEKRQLWLNIFSFLLRQKRNKKGDRKPIVPLVFDGSRTRSTASDVGI